MREIDWLNVPMLKNLRTVVTDLFASEESWLDALRFAGGNAFKSLPNVKYIFFVGNPLFKHKGINPHLVRFLDANGVQSRLVEDSSWDKTMELDYKLNGPMNS
ncbi:uncharacterized protein MELLADRAFT_74138 [Melampsora larici-populina 98AG31]|uniref:Uncharacterized protein n=1 Tax=Melampsora larici-populina (strain 98AG31 / pathotype 3-4-7) TaxID=747676 RepID=F4R9Q8_MELLP|nr:uncharacterized protein MELLADRAFT_74138 [Melampsora larici-populina 98AG31]EGG11021.1 hypothetical protein MELLADRAFT_74138 [Melampsora larici-populina 98AG31]